MDIGDRVQYRVYKAYWSGEGLWAISIIDDINYEFIAYNAHSLLSEIIEEQAIIVYYEDKN